MSAIKFKAFLILKMIVKYFYIIRAFLHVLALMFGQNVPLASSSCSCIRQRDIVTPMSAGIRIFLQIFFKCRLPPRKRACVCMRATGQSFTSH